MRSERATRASASLVCLATIFRNRRLYACAGASELVPRPGNHMGRGAEFIQGCQLHLPTDDILPVVNILIKTMETDLGIISMDAAGLPHKDRGIKRDPVIRRRSAPRYKIYPIDNV